VNGTVEKMSDDSVDNGSSALSLSLGTVGAGSGIGALLIFMLQNTAQTRVAFLWFDFTWPLWLLILFSAAFGALIWIGLGILRRHRRRKARRAARKG